MDDVKWLKHKADVCRENAIEWEDSAVKYERIIQKLLEKKVLEK